MSAPVEVEHEVEIRRPRGEVFDAVSDRERLPAWTAGVKRVRRTPGQPIGVGATYTIVGQLLGRRVGSTYEVTAYEPEERFAGRLTSPAFSAEETYRLDERDGATGVQVRLVARPQGWLRLLGPLLGIAVGRQVRSDHARLKVLLERSRPVPPAAATASAHAEDEPTHDGGEEHAREG